MHDFSYLKELFNIDDSLIEYLKTKKNKVFNPSVSSLGINFFLFLNKFFDLEKNQNLINNLMKQSLSKYQSTNKYLYRIKYRLLSYLKLKELFQYTIDRKIKVKKHKINRDYINKLINIDKMI